MSLQSTTPAETLAPKPFGSAGIHDPRQFDDPTRRALADLILALADLERLLGFRSAEWSDGVPALDAAVASSAMGQDELGHSRTLLPLLKDFPKVDPSMPDGEPREEHSSIAFLDRKFSHWASFVAANVMIGTTLTAMLEAARESTYVPLKTHAVEILNEERFHWVHGEGWFKRLAADEKEGMELAFQIEEILPQALCWFGPADDVQLLQAGIVDAAGDELRARFMKRVGPLLAMSQASQLVKIESGKWQYARNLPWSKFDAVTRRIK